MKGIKIRRTRGKGLLLVLACCLLSAGIVATIVGYGALEHSYTNRAIITDMASQVEIVVGKMVPADTIAYELGLKPGANLAEIDFSDKRESILRKIPNFKDVHITRIEPSRVRVVIEERIPMAKLSVHGFRKTTGKVVDSDGMVFMYQRGTQLLPTIREAQAPGTAAGHKLRGNARSALKLLEACREPEFADLGISDIDLHNGNYLLATLGNYSRAKISWEEMGSDSAKERHSLNRRLQQLAQAIKSGACPGSKIWNATIPNRIFADTQERN